MSKKTLIYLVVYATLGLFFIAMALTGALSSNVMRYLVQIFLYISIGEVWNLLSGYAGMTSLGQQAFIGLAGYSVAMATTVYKLHFGLGILIGVGISAIVATVLAFLLLRMRGMYFSITTWVVAEVTMVAF
jgi:branched-chain amino acid transport system permease protein